jgi:3-oxoacyl-[acyl-carrier-protein] synthase II
MADMVSQPRRIALTGLGVLSPIGTTPEAVWQSLVTGASGVRAFSLVDAAELPTRVAGEVPGFSGKSMLAETKYRKEFKSMGRTVELGLIGTQLAMQGAGLAKGSVPPQRVGIEFASLMAPTDLNDLAAASRLAAPEGRPVDYSVWGDQGLKEIIPFWMLKYLPNMAACHSTIVFDLQGPSNTQIPGDAAGLVALAEAGRALRRGAADVMVVGGSEGRLSPITLARYNLALQLSKRNDDPAGALRPFDATRDGTVYSEGAAVFTLEDLDHARKRGATILGEVSGWAMGVDRGCKGPGLARVIRNALSAAGIQPGDVDHVNAHGLATTAGDAFEARGIAEVFGQGTPVFAPLSYFGNTGAASGLLELACSVLALRHGCLPGTLNYQQPDPACPIAVHAGDPRPVKKPYAVKVSYTPLGQCAAAVVKRWEA